MRVRSRSGSVSQDWRKPLSSEKTRTYAKSLRILETAYAMFSVNLDEAFGFRRCGRTTAACQVLSVAPALCRRLAVPLHSLLGAMLDHAKHFGTTPNLVPLMPENFQHGRSQRVALFNDLFSKVLLTRRSQFIHKIAALSDLVHELGSSFEDALEGLNDEEESSYAEPNWELLDSMHYDLNTCLRETDVLLKSFLHALPEGQLDEFRAKLRARGDAGSSSTEPHVTHRRIALLKGQ